MLVDQVDESRHSVAIIVSADGEGIVAGSGFLKNGAEAGTVERLFVAEAMVYEGFLIFNTEAGQRRLCCPKGADGLQPVSSVFVGVV